MIGILGGTVTASARAAGHSISFAITLTMMVGITAYTFYTSKRRYGRHFHKYGPTYLVIMSTLLIMADLMRHVLQDANIWPEPGSRQYNPGCHDETFHCLSPVGWIFTIFCTYIGFALLMFGTMWNADLIGKLQAMRDKWRELRGTTQAQ